MCSAITWPAWQTLNRQTMMYHCTKYTAVRSTKYKVHRTRIPSTKYTTPFCSSSVTDHWLGLWEFRTTRTSRKNLTKKWRCRDRTPGMLGMTTPPRHLIRAWGWSYTWQSAQLDKAYHLHHWTKCTTSALDKVHRWTNLVHHWTKCAAHKEDVMGDQCANVTHVHTHPQPPTSCAYTVQSWGPDNIYLHVQIIMGFQL